MQNIPSQAKASFTRDYNKHHDNKDGFTKITKGAKAAKPSSNKKDDEDSESEVDSMMGEDEMAERRKGREMEK